MNSSHITRNLSQSPRIAALVLAALLSIGTPLHANVVSGTVAAATNVAKGVLGIPFKILSTVAKGVSKAAGNAVTSHVTKS